MKKKLIIINGTMGIGKTTVSTALKNELENSVMLDGDWCWMMNPWKVTDENVKMVEQNIAYLLNQFLNNSSFEYIIFTWVIHKEEILNHLLAMIKNKNYEIYRFTLICDKEELVRRMKTDNRNELVIKNSIERIPLYSTQDSVKIDTTKMDTAAIVNQIKSKVKK